MTHKIKKHKAVILMILRWTTMDYSIIQSIISTKKKKLDSNNLILQNRKVD
jgi:hypothetical protein